MLAHIEFTNDLLIGNTQLDDQHRHLISLYNKFINVVNSDNKNINNEIHKVINDLMEYTKYHFSLEETFMDSFGYSCSDDHKDNHMVILEKLTQYCFDILYGLTDIEEFAEFFKKWIVGHIKHSDYLFIREYTIKTSKNMHAVGS